MSDHLAQCTFRCSPGLHSSAIPLQPLRDQRRSTILSTISALSPRLGPLRGGRATERGLCDYFHLSGPVRLDSLKDPLRDDTSPSEYASSQNIDGSIIRLHTRAFTRKIVFCWVYPTSLLCNIPRRRSLEYLRKSRQDGCISMLHPQMDTFGTSDA